MLAVDVAAQTAVYRVLRDTGPNANRINVTILGDGFTASEQEHFFTVAQQKFEALINNESFAPSKDLVNGFAVFTASGQSGTDIPAQSIARDTYYDTGFSGSINSRLLTVGTSAGSTRARDILRTHTPEYDIALILVNTTTYGGAGGSPIILSVHSSADEIMLHELGHSFARLTDEYVDAASAPFYPPMEYVNATQKTTPAEIPWRDFLLPSTLVPTLVASDDANFVGLWEGAHYRAQGFYRPTYNSKMRSLGQPFGPVNLRAYAAAMHRLNLNQTSIAPADVAILRSTAADGTLTLTASAQGAGPFTYQWSVEGKFLPGETRTTFVLSNASLVGTRTYAVEITNAAGSVSGTVPRPTAAVGKDFGGDGRSDILWSNADSGVRSLWQMNGTTIVTGAVLGTVPLVWSISATGDFNGDGKGDLFWTNTSTGDRAAWLMNGATVTTNAYLGVVPVAWTASGTGDFNGDGKQDILWTNTSTGDRAMWFMNGGTVLGGGFLTTVPLVWQVRGTGDYNGDGKADILWSNTTTGERTLWLMNGTTISSGAVIATIPTEWSISASGDYNGDGKADIFFTNTTTGDRALWLMNGATVALNAYLSVVPVGWTVSATGDYNGDGKADVLWTNTATGDRAMWFMNGGTVLGGGFLTTVPLEWRAIP